jgi:DNA-binding response OmpR family regulator
VDAITLAEVEHPDVVLLDIMMPQLDGFTLCKMMRVHPATMNLPIVFVTAYSSLDLEDRRKEAGADMVLPKPIGMDTLVDAVEKATTLRPAKVAEPPAPVAEIKTAAVPTSATDTQESKATPSADGKQITQTPEPKPTESVVNVPAKTETPVEVKPSSEAVPATPTPEKKPGES